MVEEGEVKKGRSTLGGWGKGLIVEVIRHFKAFIFNTCNSC